MAIYWCKWLIHLEHVDSYAIPSSEELMSKMVDPAAAGEAADDIQAI